MDRTTLDRPDELGRDVPRLVSTASGLGFLGFSAAGILLATVHELTYLARGPAHVLPLGLFLGAVSGALWRSRLVPQWVTWTGSGCSHPLVAV